VTGRIRDEQRDPRSPAAMACGDAGGDVSDDPRVESHPCITSPLTKHRRCLYSFESNESRWHEREPVDSEPSAKELPMNEPVHRSPARTPDRGSLFTRSPARRAAERYSTVDQTITALVPSGNGSSVQPQRTSFESVYRAMIGFVRRVVNRQPIPPAHRDDAVQDVFMIAYRRWNQLDDAHSLRAWLHGIAVRTCWNYQRAHRRYQFWMAPTHESADDLPDGDGVLDQQLAHAEDLRWLEQAVERLDDKHKEALILNRIEGKSAAEVSRMTGLSPNTVASRVRAALRELRDDLSEREGPGGRRLVERKA
jgi:RNA polymerase sigma-70 factor, ECF subfamily